MPTPDPNNPTTVTNTPDPAAPTNAPDPAAPTNAPQQPDTDGVQTGSQNPEAHREGDLAAEAAHAGVTADNATSRGGYGASAQGDYDNRDGSPAAPTNASSHPGNQHGYTNEEAHKGSEAQGTGSRGGSYNDQNANAPHNPDAGRRATDAASTTGSASGLVNTGPDQQQNEQQARHNAAANAPDSGGASTGRTPDATERV